MLTDILTESEVYLSGYYAGSNLKQAGGFIFDRESRLSKTKRVSVCGQNILTVIKFFLEGGLSCVEN
jgi:hypothetical protein